MGEQNVRDECKERVFYTIDYTTKELMEYFDEIKKKRHKTQDDEY